MCIDGCAKYSSRGWIAWRVVPGNHDGRRGALRGLCRPAPARACGTSSTSSAAGRPDRPRFQAQPPSCTASSGARSSRGCARSSLRVLRRLCSSSHHPPIAIGTWWLDKDRLRDRAALRETDPSAFRARSVCGPRPPELRRRVRFGRGALLSVDRLSVPSEIADAPPRSRHGHPAGRLIDLDGEAIKTRCVEMQG